MEDGKFKRETKRFFLFLLAVLGLRLIANMLMPLTDPSEARYALICKIMAETGNFLEPQLIHEGSLINFEGKPPLYFQMGALCCKMFGVNLFAVRFPATIFASVLTLGLYGTVRKLQDETTAKTAVVLMLLCPVFSYFSGAVMTDMALACAISCAIFSYMLFDAAPAHSRERKFASIGFFASFAVGMLVKGPVAIVMGGLPVFFFVLLSRRWKDLKDHAWFAGPVVFLLIAAPWYILMQMKNPEFLEYFFVNENFKRFLFKEYGDQYGAGRESFRGMALFFMFAVNAPIVLIWTLRKIIPPKKKQNAILLVKGFRSLHPMNRMAILAVACITLFWCLTSRVLITYLLPTAPFFAIAAAFFLRRCGQIPFSVITSSRIVIRIAAGFILAIQLVFCMIPLFAESFIETMPGSFFKRVAKEIPEGQFYFYRKVPYSAYYYLGDRVVRHPDETTLESQKNAKPYYILSRRKDVVNYPIPDAPPILMETPKWVLLDRAQ